MMNKKMRVCIVAEGCYPYVIGGVSGWINSMIRSFPNIEFIVLAIVANRSLRGKFQYELPENLTEVYEVYLEDQDWIDKKKKSRYHLSKEEYNEMRNLVMNRKSDWNVLFELFRKPFFSINDFLMGDDFYYIVRECYDRKYANSIFSVCPNGVTLGSEISDKIIENRTYITFEMLKSDQVQDEEKLGTALKAYLDKQL